MAKMPKAKHGISDQHPSPPNTKEKLRGTDEAGLKKIVPSKAEKNVVFPLAFPRDVKDLLLPKSGFLRNEGDSKNSFQMALRTSYEGFAYDNANEERIFAHEEIKKSLLAMDSAGMFRTDVTQPFGLGTKCAKTYVTRCLLGEEGTTYKYLGLRMFSHPWNGGGVPSQLLQKSIYTISQLNAKLVERTKAHLQDLAEKRLERGRPAPQGRALFDVALINKMEFTGDLKTEPMFGTERCAVAWHADSSLEHYSTIAVYHTILKHNQDEVKIKDGDRPSKGDWSVALRVVHNAEGPAVPRRRLGNDLTSSIVTDTPPIAVTLSSGSAYYLLDDHNHHHQHAVIAPREGAVGTRFSSTHRLLREGHTVQCIIARCASVVSNFHRKGIKVWRAEQLLLNEIEFEWLRQFYIQGEGNKELLWKYWKEPICTLLKYWSQLETRTQQVTNILKLAAEERCGYGRTAEHAVISRSVRKLRDKRKKALSAIEDIMDRGGTKEDTSPNELIYKGIASLLSERAALRNMWSKRELDPVFSRMEVKCRPISFPVVYNCCDGNAASKNNIKVVDDEIGRSPFLDGSPEFLSKLAKDMEQWGDCFRSKDLLNWPTSECMTSASGTTVNEKRVAQSVSM